MSRTCTEVVQKEIEEADTLARLLAEQSSSTCCQGISLLVFFVTTLNLSLWLPECPSTAFEQPRPVFEQELPFVAFCTLRLTCR